MSREIKFRAWDKLKNKMLPVWSIGWKTWDRFVCDDLPINFVEVEDDGTYQLQEHEAELMQYTGLKDKNGKEIYEGDILVAKPDYFYVADMYTFMGRDDVLPNNYCTIVGNIYENPELLHEQGT